MAIEFAPLRRPNPGPPAIVLPYRESVVEHIVQTERPVCFGFMQASRTITTVSKYQKAQSNGIPVPER